MVSWDDGVKGRISIANAELDDLVIARADGSPTYNFCVVVDDMDMAISHVVRGDDHINNTPRQMNILKALGAVIPQYAHLPMIHGPGWREALQAPRGCIGDAIRARWLHAAGAFELPCSAWLEPWR